MLAHQLASELESILARGMRELVHEAFEEDRILVDVHAAPEARRDVRVAHRMVDQQVRDGVSDGEVPSRVEPLERERVLAVLEGCRPYGAEDRLARKAHVQAGEVVAGV